MLKRVRWIGTGVLLGAGGSLWAQVQLRRRARRYSPPEIASRIAGRTAAVRRDLHSALTEGREAMLEREAELRSLVVDRRPPSR